MYGNDIFLFTTEKAADEFAEQQGWEAWVVLPPNTMTNQPEFEDDEK